MKTGKRVYFIVMVGVLSALAVSVALLIHFPIFPAVPFLEYDPADVVIYLATYLFGMPMGLIITAIVSIIQGITVSASSGIYGIISHILATGSYVVIAGLIRKWMKKKSGMPVSVVLGAVATTAIMTGWNMLIVPLYMPGATTEYIVSILGFIVLFNLIKTCVNGTMAVLLTLALEKPLGAITKKL